VALDQLAERIIRCALAVSNTLGVGFLGKYMKTHWCTSSEKRAYRRHSKPT
jgi:hypothetical protein